MHEYLINKNLLLVDDNQTIGEMVQIYCHQNQLSIDYLADSRVVLEHLNHTNYDLIILDIAMPNLDGFELFKLIKANFIVPVIFLSARGQEQDRIEGLLLGVDDYLVKPFSLAELMIRVENVLRRNTQLIISNQNIEINLASHLITYNHQIIKLTPRGFDIFLYLFRNKGKICSRQELMINVLNIEYYLDDRVIDAHIKEIRKKIDSKIIKTIRGRGYIYGND